MERYYEKRGQSLYMCFVETPNYAPIRERLEARGGALRHRGGLPGREHVHPPDGALRDADGRQRDERGLALVRPPGAGAEARPRLTLADLALVYSRSSALVLQLASGRQLDGDRRAAAGRAVDLEAAVVAVGDPLGDGEAESAAAHLPRTRLVRAVEAVEDVRERLGRDALAVVGDGDPHVAVLLARR